MNMEQSCVCVTKECAKDTEVQNRARALVKHGSQRGANRLQQLCAKPLLADGRKASQL